MYKNFKNKAPRLYIQDLLRRGFVPSIKSKDRYVFRKIGGFRELVIKDEQIKHLKPVPHVDYAYGTRGINVPRDLVSVFAIASESIFVDRLKKEVTARCATMVKNAVTLGFVEDAVDVYTVVMMIKKGKSKDTIKSLRKRTTIPLTENGTIDKRSIAKEYGRRIKADITPRWFPAKIKKNDQAFVMNILSKL